MSTATVATFLSLLAIIALVAVMGSCALAAAARRHAGAARLQAAVAPAALWLAVAVALTATAGSLYFSEIAHFTPCVLCWYQRIAMYSLVAVLGIAAVRSDFGVRRYALPLALVGAGVSAYHIGVERIPALAASSACNVEAPCDLRWIDVFGVFTIPTLALVAFVAIATGLSVYGPRTSENA